MKNAKLNINEVPAYAFRAYGDRAWTFIKHSKKSESNYDLRWVICWRRRDDWWGVVALFPATHENALSKIGEEMDLAQQAIKILKGELLEAGDAK